MSRKSGMAARGFLPPLYSLLYARRDRRAGMAGNGRRVPASATADDLEAQGYDVQMARYRRRNRLLIAPQILVNVK